MSLGRSAALRRRRRPSPPFLFPSAISLSSGLWLSSSLLLRVFVQGLRPFRSFFLSFSTWRVSSLAPRLSLTLLASAPSHGVGGSSAATGRDAGVSGSRFGAGVILFPPLDPLHVIHHVHAVMSLEWVRCTTSPPLTAIWGDIRAWKRPGYDGKWSRGGEDQDLKITTNFPVAWVLSKEAFQTRAGARLE
jgi:hypothetical protein